MQHEQCDGIAAGARPVQVVARAVHILRVLGESTADMTLAQIAERSGLPRSTVHRIVRTLRELRLVVQEPREGGLRLGPEFARLAADSRIQLIHVVQPYLEQLSRALGETVGLAVLDGPKVRFLDTAVAAHRPAPVSLVCSVPAHCTANGKALLAELPTPELEATLPERLPRLTDRTIATHPELMVELERVRNDGIAFSREEYAEGVCGVAKVIHDGGGHLGAITVALPAQQFYGREHELAGAVREAVEEVNVALARTALRPFAKQFAGSME
jgi:DNA-binding IclR family transcriptional regulator